eukprot:g14135.t1
MRSRLAGAADTAVAPFLVARWALWARKCPALRSDAAGENADGADEDADSFMKLANSTYSTVVEEKEPLAAGDEVGDDLSVGTLVVLIFDKVGESKDKPRGIPNSGKQSGIYVVTKSKSGGAPAADQEENSAPTSSTTLLQRVDVHDGKLQVTDATIVHDKDQAYRAFPFPRDEGVTVRVQAADETKSGLYQLSMKRIGGAPHTEQVQEEGFNQHNLRAVLKRATNLETRFKGMTETFFGIAEKELGQRLHEDLKRQFGALRTEMSGAQQEEVAEEEAEQEQENSKEKDGNAPDADENDKGNKKGTAGRRAGGAKKGFNPITALRRALRRRIRVRRWKIELAEEDPGSRPNALGGWQIFRALYAKILSAPASAKQRKYSGVEVVDAGEKMATLQPRDGEVAEPGELYFAAADLFRVKVVQRLVIALFHQPEVDTGSAVWREILHLKQNIHKDPNVRFGMHCKLATDA